jgi:hypothetical protein
MKYLLTVLERKENKDVATDVLYCGRDWSRARSALDSARENKTLIGKRLLLLTTTDDGKEVVRRQITAVY